MMSIHDVTAANQQAICALQVAKAQIDFIETPSECLAEAEVCQAYKPVGLYLDDEPVGFAMYAYFQSKETGGRLWIDRFLIDVRFQGKGLGAAFMQAMIEKVQQEYGVQPIFLSVYENNEAAIRLYQKLDFYFIDEWDTKGERLMVRDVR